MDKNVIGIAGISKNAGKTTVITSILSLLREKKKTFCITSIGYDGEDLDNITYLPKPRIFIKKGEYAASASKCINNDNWEIINSTDIQTPLGNILIGRAKRDNKLVTAGANKSSDLKTILAKLNFDYILVDGALNRIAPMSECKSIIVSIGAARSTDINMLINIAKSIEYIFSIEALENQKISGYKNITLFDDDFNATYEHNFSSFIVDENVNYINDTQLRIAKYIYIPGVFIPEIGLKLFNKKYRKNELTIILNNQVQLLSSADSLNMQMAIEKLKRGGIHFKVINKIELNAMTVNPFYPRYDFRNNTYDEAYIDDGILYSSVKKSINTPVFDVVKYGYKSLNILF